MDYGSIAMIPLISAHILVGAERRPGVGYCFENVVEQLLLDKGRTWTRGYGLNVFLHSRSAQALTLVHFLQVHS